MTGCHGLGAAHVMFIVAGRPPIAAVLRLYTGVESAVYGGSVAAGVSSAAAAGCFTIDETSESSSAIVLRNPDTSHNTCNYHCTSECQDSMITSLSSPKVLAREYRVDTANSNTEHHNKHSVQQRTYAYVIVLILRSV